MLSIERFPQELAKWDRFKAFHVGVGKTALENPREYHPHSLVLFDTGELIAFNCRGAPYKRGHYRPVGVSLLTTDDLTLYKPNGEPVPKSHLNYEGTQQVLVDWQSARCVCVSPHWFNETPTPAIPTRLRDFGGAYIGGEGSMPVGKKPLKLSLPLSKAGYTKDELARLDEYVRVMRVTALMTEHEVTKYKYYGSCYTYDNPDKLLAGVDWRILDKYEQLRLFRGGLGRRIVNCDYLLATPDGSPYEPRS